ncbi:MAG: hypothetical protein ACFFAN_13160 [Promethearchaeota archaeon]
MYEKSFQDISSAKMELFSSFFSALKTFISEMVLEGGKELKTIEMGDYTVLITTINEINLDLVIIGDKEDYKLINKLIPKIIKILLNHKQLLIEWKGKKTNFEILDFPISEIVQSNKKLLGEKTLFTKTEEILKSIWAHKKDLSPQEKENLIKEKEILSNKLSDLTNVKKQLDIHKRLLEISEKLKDEKAFIKYQQEIKRLKDEIKDIKLKLNYYLGRIKNTISIAVNMTGTKPLRKGDYKEVYLNLYSFSLKLKKITDDSSWKYYQNMANILINNDEVTDHEFSEIITTILKMKEDIEDFIN